MNDFGEMSSTGVVLSNSEMRERRLKRGECETCGTKCFKKTLFKSTPITENGKVLNGRCLTCHPLDVSEMTSSPLTAQVEIASSRDLDRANRSMGTLNTSFKSRLPRRGLKTRSVSDGNVHDPNIGANPSSRNVSIRSSPNDRMGCIEEEKSKDPQTTKGVSTPKDSDSKDISLPMSSSDRNMSLSSRSPTRSNAPTNGVQENVVVAAASLHLQRNFRSMKLQQDTSASQEVKTINSIERRPSLLIKHDSARSTASTASRSSSHSKDQKPTALDEERAIEILKQPNCDIRETLELVRDFANIESVEEAAIKAIADCTVKVLPESEARIFLDKRAAGIKFLLSMMSCQSSELSRDAWFIIRNISSNCKVLQEAIGKNGGTECVLNYFDFFDDDAEMQIVCLDFLRNLSEPNSNHFYMLCEGIDRFVIKAMETKCESVEVQQRCCDIIVKLSEDSSLRSGMVEANGSGQIAIAMIMFLDDVKFVKLALNALRALAYDSPDNKRSIAESGAIDSIVSAMQKHRDDPKIQAAAAWTLGEVALSPDSAVIVAESGGIDVIARAIYVHEGSQSVIKRSCSALDSLSVPNANRALMVEIGVIAAIVHTMHRHQDIVSIQKQCYRVLSTLAEGNGRFDVIKKKIVDHEALDSIAMTMVMNGENDELQKIACSLLCNLACDATFESLLAAGSPELMKAAAGRFSVCRESAEYMMMMLNRHYN